MFFKFLALTTIFLVCEATIPDRLYYRRAPLRFIFNQQGRRPSTWNYQIVNGRPVLSGFPNPNAYVAFGLNPQTGQIEQTQIITQTRPGGPFINMIQNMLHVAGQFFGQVTGAFGNAVGGALQTAGQFGQEIQDLTNPVISVTGISQTASEKEPIQQPNQPVTEEVVRPPLGPAVETPTQPSEEAPSVPAIETAPEQAKSEFQTASSTIDQAIISFQTLRTNVQANFQNFFESTEGAIALEKISENINSGVSRLQNLRETVVVDSVKALQAAQITVNTVFDNIENTLVNVAGAQGRDFLAPTRTELNKTFNDALTEYREINGVSNSKTEISPAA